MCQLKSLNLYFHLESNLVTVFQVMFRLNLLTVSLCLCMNRPYQFYHFVPLVSFWFLVIYFLAWLPPRIYSGSLAEYGPRALLYFALKLLSLVSIITILYMSEVINNFYWRIHSKNFKI